MDNGQQGDAWMTAIIEASTDAIISFTPKGEVLSWNPGAEVMFGYAASEVIGQSLSILAPPHLEAEHQRILQAVQCGRNINQLDTVCIDRFGKMFPVCKTISPVRDEHGKVVGAIAVIQDITERKRSEQHQALLGHISAELVSLDSIEITMERLGEAIGRHFDATRCLFAEHTNHQETVVISYDWHIEGIPSMRGTYRLRNFLSDEQLAANNAGELSIVNDTQTDARVNAANYGALGMRSFIMVPLARDGRWQFSLSVIDSRPRQWRDDEIGLLQEIATRIWTRLERARAEEALHKNQERFRALIDKGVDVITISNRDGRITYASPSLEAMTGYPVEEFVSVDPFHSAIHPDDLAMCEAALTELSTNPGRSIFLQHRFLHKSGKWRWLEGTFTSLFEDPAVNGLVANFRDVTERKRAEDELIHAYAAEQAARAEAEAALQTRDRFLSIASHELRTPLTSLLGYATMLPMIISEKSNMMQQMSERIIGQTQRLNMLIGQMLDSMQLRQGQFTITPQPLDIVQLVAQFIDATGSLSSAVDHTFTLTYSAESVIIMGDAERLEQMMQNLVSNATKYSPKGSAVTVRVGTAAHDAIIEVTDQGIGIPEAAREHLFEPFYRAANVGPQASGFGLGLHVVQEIVTRHGGHIEVESVEDEGSTFRIMIPLLRALTPMQAHQAAFEA